MRQNKSRRKRRLKRRRKTYKRKSFRRVDYTNPITNPQNPRNRQRPGYLSYLLRKLNHQQQTEYPLQTEHQQQPTNGFNQQQPTNCFIPPANNPRVGNSHLRRAYGPNELSSLMAI